MWAFCMPDMHHPPVHTRKEPLWPLDAELLQRSRSPGSCAKMASRGSRRSISSDSDSNGTGEASLLSILPNLLLPWSEPDNDTDGSKGHNCDGRGSSNDFRSIIERMNNRDQSRWIKCATCKFSFQSRAFKADARQAGQIPHPQATTNIGG